MQNRRLAVPGALSVLVLSLGALTFGHKKEAAPAAQLPVVTVAPVLEREITGWDEFTGRLQAVDAVEIRPRVSGYITRVNFVEGKEVKKGELLFEIDPRQYQAELARATAELERARSAAALATSDVQRADKLVRVEAISREEYDSRTSAEAQGGATVRAAEAAVQSARLNLEWTRVRSPIDGRVSNALVTPGNLVQGGPPTATLLTSVVSLDPMYLYFDSDEQTYLRYAGLARSTATNWRNARLPVYLGLANESGFPHQGRLDFVDNQVDPNTGTIRTRAIFSNRSRALTPGLFARVKLVGSEKSKALLVRDAAIGTDQDRKFVLVLGQGDTLAYRPIVPGRLSDDGLRIVTSGLTPEDRIVVNGLMRVRPGIRVAPTVAAMEPDSTPSAGGER
jgi:membrane fusion protein, multidrug efflux system